MTINTILSCKTCGLYHDNICARTNMKVNPDIDGCTHHCFNIYRCVHCNRIVLNPIIDEEKIICKQCLNTYFNTCAACRIFTERCPIAAGKQTTCEGCVCFDNVGCDRQIGYCRNYEEKI